MRDELSKVKIVLSMLVPSMLRILYANEGQPTGRPVAETALASKVESNYIA